MSDANENSGEGGGGHGMAGDAAERARRLRAQAALAWDRVQQVGRRRSRVDLSVDRMVKAAEQVPTETYLAIASGSLLASAGLHAAERNTASTFLAFSGFLTLTLAFFLKTARRPRRI